MTADEPTRADGRPIVVPGGPMESEALLQAVNLMSAALRAADPRRFWVHTDLEALSTEAMPAVDYLLPGGLDWSELTALLRPLLASPALPGVDVTIYNPSLDPERRLAPRIVQMLAEGREVA